MDRRTFIGSVAGCLVVVPLAARAQKSTLPIEQPERFELVINLKTAKVLGLTIPPSMLLQTTRVVQ